MTPLIAASILSADFAHLHDDVDAALVAGADWVHFDVMDHHFVPNLSIGPMVCEALRQSGITAPMDVHLMVENPDAYIAPFAGAGASMLTFHAPTTPDVQATIDAIKAAGMQVGMAINPDEPLDVLMPFLEQLDVVLVMSVQPGFGGQSFIPESLNKIVSLRDRLDKIKSSAVLSVDGGIKVSNVKAVIDAGADCCVMGSGLFNQPDYAETITQIRL